MDEPGTVFLLCPENQYATEIVQDAANRDRRRYLDPDIPCLRIGLDQQPKTPPHLVRFGRHERNDVILNNRFSRNDQCYFDFNKETGELLLHDVSENGDTRLCEQKGLVVGLDQLWKRPRQCVVVLAPDPYRDPEEDPNREWIFTIRSAEFRLIPRRTQGQGEAAFTEERLAFAGQPDSERTYEKTIQQFITLGLKPDALTTTYKPPSMATYNPHNTRFSTRHQPEENQVIRYTKLGRLGSGGQGEVHKVVDMHTGDHHACKIVAIRTEIPQWGIHSEKDFRARVEREVDLVQQIKHVRSLILPIGFCHTHDDVSLISYHIHSPRDGSLGRISKSLCPSMREALKGRFPASNANPKRSGRLKQKGCSTRFPLP